MMRKQKNTMITLLACLMLAILLGGCKKQMLQYEISRVNDQCPISLGLLGYVYQVSLNDNTVVYNVQLNADLLNVEKMKKDPEVMRESSLLSLVDQSEYIQTLIDQNVDVKFTLTDSVSHETIDLVITHEDLANVLKEKKADEKKFTMRRVDNQVSVTRLQLPAQIDEVTTLVDFSCEGSNAVYTYEVDKTQVTPDVLREALPNIKSQVVNNLMNDPSARGMGNLLVKADMGLIYRYRLGDVVEEFSFTADHLNRILVADNSRNPLGLDPIITQ